MLKWLAKKAQQREIDDYLLKLRGMDGDEIGGVVALAAHMRNRYLGESGRDFLQPHATTAADPTLVISLVTAAKDLQKMGPTGLVHAAALMLWIHTLRGAMNADLRPRVRDMWAEAARGFPHIGGGAAVIEAMTGQALDLDAAGRFPEGFTPQPL
ncbi:MAG: hypothetical protein ACFCUT_06875 [Kiloniellaceae bacterium]